MTPRIANITFHAADPARLARFWSAVMEYPEDPGFEPEELAALREAGLSDDDIAGRAVAWDGDPAHQRFYFTRYDHARRQRNRMHIDLSASTGGQPTREQVEAERDRLVALGATVEKVLDGAWGPYDEFAIMMRDPEGNEFCIQ